MEKLSTCMVKAAGVVLQLTDVLQWSDFQMQSKVILVEGKLYE